MNARARPTRLVAAAAVALVALVIAWWRTSARERSVPTVAVPSLAEPTERRIARDPGADSTAGERDATAGSTVTPVEAVAPGWGALSLLDLATRAPPIGTRWRLIGDDPDRPFDFEVSSDRPVDVLVGEHRLTPLDDDWLPLREELSIERDTSSAAWVQHLTTLRVQVLDAAGNAVGGAECAWFRSGAAIDAPAVVARTSDNGAAVLQRAGDVGSLHVTATGFVSAVRELRKPRTAPLVVRLGRACAGPRALPVVDALDQAVVADATIELDGAVQTRADRESGVIPIPDCVEPHVFLSVRAPGYASARASITDLDRSERITLHPTGVLELSIETADGSTPGRCSVAFSIGPVRPRHGFSPIVPPHASIENGRGEIELPRGIAVWIRALASDGREGTARVTLAAARVPLAITLGTDGELLSIVALDEQGAAVADARASVQYRDATGSSELVGPLLEVLRPRDVVRIHVSAADRATVELVPMRTRRRDDPYHGRVTLVLPRTSRVALRLVDDGSRPLAGMQVGASSLARPEPDPYDDDPKSYWPTDHPAWARNATPPSYAVSDANGQCRLLLEHGRHLLTADVGIALRARDCAIYEAETREIDVDGSRDTIVWRLPRLVHVVVEVFDAASGAPLERVAVRTPLSSPRRASGHAWEGFLSCEIRGLDVSADGYASKTIALDLAREDAVELEVRLEPLEPSRVCLIGADAKALAGAPIEIDATRMENGQRLLVARLRSRVSSDGCFSISLPAGIDSFGLSAALPGGVRWSFEPTPVPCNESGRYEVSARER